VKMFSRLLIGLSLAALPALCAPLALNGANDWYGFYWNQQGGSAFGSEPTLPSNVAYISDTGNRTVFATSPSGGPDVTSWTTNFGFAVQLTVVDLGTDGDSFSIFDNAVLIGTTGAFANNGHGCSPTSLNDPLVCFGNPEFSRGTFNLGAGAHTITIQDVTVNSQTPSGIGAFRLDLPGQGPIVPEPATVGMMALGLGALLVGRRVKRS
jgi:PEP-CTERM motif